VILIVGTVTCHRLIISFSFFEVVLCYLMHSFLLLSKTQPALEALPIPVPQPQRSSTHTEVSPTPPRTYLRCAALAATGGLGRPGARPRRWHRRPRSGDQRSAQDQSPGTGAVHHHYFGATDQRVPLICPSTTDQRSPGAINGSFPHSVGRGCVIELCSG